MKFETHVPLSQYCTYGIGGAAKRFCTITNREEAIELFTRLDKEKERFFVLGRGSNCLFDDRGFDGTVIYNKLQGIEWQEEGVLVESGYSFSLLGIQASRKGYSGLEFASGIPGSVGGAVFMNAGAGKAETKDVIREVLYLHLGGRIERILPKESLFGYRSSLFQKEQGMILEAAFALEKKEGAKCRQKALLDYRMETQPYKEKSCGCVFKNPEGASAGKLIEEAGLKGAFRGDAVISDVHANFIVNRGNATAKDVLALIHHVQKEVEQKFGHLLHPEVKYIPFGEN